MSVKWLRRLKLTNRPAHTKDETSKCTDPLPDGTARQFTFEMGVKSVITRPSSGMRLAGAGFHEISGIAWSGAGRISRVEVSTDGGSRWQAAALQGGHLAKSLVRFRAPWQWNGAPAVRQSRAIDNRFHNNSIVIWLVDADGSIKHVYL